MFSIHDVQTRCREGKIKWSLHATVIVIKNVPCEECDQCGEIEISHEVMLKIDHIIELATQLVQDVAVIDYQIAA